MTLALEILAGWLALGAFIAHPMAKWLKRHRDPSWLDPYRDDCT